MIIKPYLDGILNCNVNNYNMTFVISTLILFPLHRKSYQFSSTSSLKIQFNHFKEIDKKNLTILISISIVNLTSFVYVFRIYKT